MLKLLPALLLMLFPLSAVAAPAAQYDELSGEKWQHSQPVSLDELGDSKALAMLWRSDCAPCLREIVLLPKIAKRHPAMKFALISLQDETQTRKYLPALPANVHVLVARDDAKAVLESFGDDKLALPFSAALHPNSTICANHYGIVGTDLVNEWEKIC